MKEQRAMDLGIAADGLEALRDEAAYLDTVIR
jgi:hypothetical protein